MITFYNKNETNFTHNGLGVLDNYIVNPTVIEELNGSFRLEFDYPIQGKYAKELLPERIIKSPVPELSDQLFRISERNEILGGLMRIVAFHIFYDLAKNFIEDTYLVNRTGAQALTQILSNTQFAHGFSSTSNISTVNNARLVRLNPVEVLMDSQLDNGYLASWGGEIIRNNLSISMLNKRGSNNGVSIRDKKNLTGYQSNIDYSTIVTRIMPQGFDGLFLPEKYVDSPLINNYISPKIKVIKYDFVKVGTEEGEVTQQEAYRLLRELARNEYAINQIDKPCITYDVSFAPLQHTKEYKEFSALETIAMGDSVSVIHEEVGLNISARMIAYEFDPLRKAYRKITLGTFLPKFSDIGKDINRITDMSQQARQDSNVALSSANGKNTNYYGSTTPSRPKEGDLWFKENGDKTEIWIYETRDGITQWFPLSTDLTQEQIKQELAQAQSEVEQAKTAADNATQAGQNALNAANQAKTDATNAVTKANDAFSNAQNALSESVQAKTIAESFGLAITKTQKVVNDALGATVLQSEWQQGSLNTSNGSESTSSSYVRSGYFEVVDGKKYLLQTYEGQALTAIFGTLYLFYYKEDKSFLSYATFNNTTPFTVPTNAKYLRVRLTTTNPQSNINCVLLQTDVANGFVDLTSISNVVKLSATSEAMMVKVEETQSAIGVPFKVKKWEQGNLSTTDGSEIASTSYLRSNYIDVKVGEKYIGQLPDGTSAITFYYHYFGRNVPYVDVVPAAKQFAEILTAGSYTNATIASYLLSKDVENLAITTTPTTNPYTSSGDYLLIYKLPLSGRIAPKVITWTGRKDTSDSTVWLYAEGEWSQIATINSTSSTNQTYEWTLTSTQQASITSDNVYLAFFSIKTGSYAGIYNNSTTPFVLNPESVSLLYQISQTNSSGTITIPANTVKMRVRVNTTIKPDVYQGNVYLASARQDYTTVTSLYSALLMTKDLINLRVAKDDVINQINISTESILIAGNKVRITGQTTIDNGIITNAMIANATIANAKIASLDAGKINTGTLAADRIAAGSITSAKLTIADGFITNGMIANATIQSAKIATIDAGKITTGTLSADRIAANSITADKVSSNFLTALTGSNSIRITGTTIGYYSGNTLVTEINSQGMVIKRDGVEVGRIGANNIINQSTWRGLCFDLDFNAKYMSWSSKDTSTATAYTIRLAWYSSKLQNGMEKGFHFADTVYFKSTMGTATSSGTAALCSVDVLTLSSTAYLAFRTTTGKAGIAMAGSNLILGDDGEWCDFGIIREICKKLAGKSIALPTGFNSSGAATGWYNAQTFNSYTYWST